MQDPGEPGIGDVTINLLADLDGDGNFTDVVATTTTDEDGAYLFTGLTPGDYVVDVTDTASVLSGYTLTTGPQSSTDPTPPINVAAGELYLNADFGYFKSGLGTIGDQIWFDDDGDGIFDASESGIGGVTISLIEDTDGDGIWDVGEPIISSVTTATDGTYLFSGLSLADGGVDSDADYLVIVTDFSHLLGSFTKTL